MKIYVASSWRNSHQPWIVEGLRSLGLDVYDFRAPAPGNDGFRWSEIDPEWKAWDAARYRAALQHPIAKRGYGYDIAALRGCDVCVMVLPCGRSANWEFGYAMGQGKRGIVVQLEPQEPELMYSEATIVTSWAELRACFEAPSGAVRGCGRGLAFGYRCGDAAPGDRVAFCDDCAGASP